MRTVLIALATLLAIHVVMVFADTPALVLYHDMLISVVRGKEPGVQIVYTPDRVEFRTRRSILVGWADVVLTARFERNAGHIQLVAQSLRAGPLPQTGKRFEEARAGLLKLVDVETDATSVEVHQGKSVHVFPVFEIPDHGKWEAP